MYEHHRGPSKALWNEVATNSILFTKASDRDKPTIGGSMVDEGLRVLLLGYYADDAKLSRELAAVRPSGRLGFVGPRITLRTVPSEAKDLLRRNPWVSCFTAWPHASCDHLRAAREAGTLAKARTEFVTSEASEGMRHVFGEYVAKVNKYAWAKRVPRLGWRLLGLAVRSRGGWEKAVRAYATQDRID